MTSENTVHNSIHYLWDFSFGVQWHLLLAELAFGGYEYFDRKKRIKKLKYEKYSFFTKNLFS